VTKSFFITGTDTEIGKTFITCGLIEAFRQANIRAAPMKPIAAGTLVQNGVTLNEDVHQLLSVYAASIDIAKVNPYCFDEAIAPHLAARHARRNVEMAVIKRAHADLLATHDVVLVEGAGGFLVPLSDSVSISVLPQQLCCEVILVVGMRLGCLNHALLTVEAIQSRGLKLAGWVANTVDANMSCLDENVDTLTQLLPAPCLGFVPRLTISPNSPNTLMAETAKKIATHLRIESLLK
jgi:dethiobiotin synthetase